MTKKPQRLVKVRLQGDKNDVEALRQILLEKCPELVLGSPREEIRYVVKQKWVSYGNYLFNVIRKRRS